MEVYLAIRECVVKEPESKSNVLDASIDFTPSHPSVQRASRCQNPGRVMDPSSQRATSLAWR